MTTTSCVCAWCGAECDEGNEYLGELVCQPCVDEYLLERQDLALARADADE